MGQQASTGLTTFNSFWVYVTPLFGAYIADTYWGRYKTICVAVAIALAGHVLLIISSIPTVIDHPHGALACFCIALIVMGAGTGGFGVSAERSGCQSDAYGGVAGANGGVTAQHFKWLSSESSEYTWMTWF